MSRPTPPTYKTRNWPAYNKALKRRGFLAIWFDPAMTWEAAPTGKRGRQPDYTDAAIQTLPDNESTVRAGAAPDDRFRREPVAAGRRAAVPVMNAARRWLAQVVPNVPMTDKWLYGTGNRPRHLRDYFDVSCGKCRLATALGPSPKKKVTPLPRARSPE